MLFAESLLNISNYSADTKVSHFNFIRFDIKTTLSTSTYKDVDYEYSLICTSASVMDANGTNVMGRPTQPNGW